MLTPQLRKALLYIQDYTDASGGVAPTYEEICTHMGTTSRSAAHRLVYGLRQRGYLRTIPFRARALEVVKRVKPLYAAYVFDDATKELRRM